MSNIVIQTEVRPSFDEVAKKFGRAHNALLESMREELHKEGPVIVVMAQGKLREKIGRTSSLDNSFRYTSQQSGENTVQLTVSAPGHAKPHKIRARYASALSFFWPRVGLHTFVPKRGGFRTHVRGGALWIGKGYVDHPGGSLVPLMTPVMKKTERQWVSSRQQIVMNRMTARYTQVFTK